MEGEKHGWKTIDTSTEDNRSVIDLSYLKFKVTPSYIYSKLYFMLLSGIVPRPVAFVSTISDTGVENLAPFRLVR